VPPSKRFAAIPIGGYRPAVARRGPRGVTKAGRDRIARPRPEIRQIRASVLAGSLLTVGSIQKS